MREWFRKLLGPYGPETRKVQLGFFFGSWAVLAAVGLFIPEKVLSENEWAWRFSDFMASFIPQIDRITALNLRPEVNKFHYSILWAVSPVYSGLLMPSVIKAGKLKAMAQGTSYGQALAGLMFFSLLAGFTMFLWGGIKFIEATDHADRIVRIMFYHAGSRTIWAPLMVFGFWMSLSAILFIVWGFITGCFHRARSETHGG